MMHKPPQKTAEHWTKSRPSGVNSSNETTKDTCRIRASRMRKRMRFSGDLQPNPDSEKTLKSRPGTPFNRNYTRALRKAAILRSAQLDPEKMNSPFLLALISPRNNKNVAFATCELGKPQNKEGDCGRCIDVKRELEEKDRIIDRIQAEKKELEERLKGMHCKTKVEINPRQMRNKAAVAYKTHGNRVGIKTELQLNKERVKNLIEQLKLLKYKKGEEQKSPRGFVEDEKARTQRMRPNSTKATAKKMVFDVVASPMAAANVDRGIRMELYRTNPTQRAQSCCARKTDGQKGKGLFAEELAVLKRKIMQVVSDSDKKSQILNALMQGAHKLNIK